MRNVQVKVDGMMALTGALVAGGTALYLNRGKIGNLINPTHQDNVINQGAKAVVGEQRLQGFFDHVFAAADLVNPLNESDVYARQVWGLDPEDEAAELAVMPAYDHNGGAL